MGRLEGKVAVVFGAGPNIGGTIAHFFAREGAKVAVVDVHQPSVDDTVAFLSGRGFDALGLIGCGTEEADVSRVIGEAEGRFGHIDIVVNAVGAPHWCSVLDMEMSDWNACLTGAPTAAMLATKHGARSMVSTGRRGSIIHILSTAAHFGEAGASAYAASKAATLGFARSAAMDLAHEGIRVNTITPCGMEHNLWGKKRDEVFKPDAVPARTPWFYSREDYLKMIPLERFPRASDIGSAAVFLASEEASFLTGVDIPVDGGLRFKYPIWRPGDFTGVNLRDYVEKIEYTRYGEAAGKLVSE